MSKVVYDAYIRIMISLRIGVTPPVKFTLFDSVLDIIVAVIWEIQQGIGWNQIVKGRSIKN